MHFPRIYVKFEIIKNFLINLVLKNMLIAYHHVNSPQSIATFGKIVRAFTWNRTIRLPQLLPRTPKTLRLA